MFFRFLFSLALVTCTVSSPTALTEVQRLARFSPRDYVIDLLASEATSSQAGGSLSRMNLETLPVSEGFGLAMTLIQLEPCGINLPHTHPRASEAIYVIDGGNVTIGNVHENGVNVVLNDMRIGQATIIPQGAIHFEQNNDCRPAVLLAANNNEDPGTLTIALRFFTLADGTLAASFGSDERTMRMLREGIPIDGPAPGTKECYRRCGLNYPAI